VNGDRLVPRSVPSCFAGRLIEHASAVCWLPPLDRCDPEAFHIAKFDLAAELRAAAMDAERGGTSHPVPESAACAATTPSQP
jgi:hypothetical protein